MYKYGPEGMILKLAEDGSVAAHIPPDPANRDYATFLAWQAEGNAPQPADPEPKSEPQPVLSDVVAALKASNPTFEAALTAEMSKQQ